jgi:UDP:flavonoid glycosyltransferase YjiC (YdhE family)
MRLTVLTFGSEGDTRPLGALCRGLLDRGHQLTLFAEPTTLTLPRQLGVPCESLPGEVQSTLPISDPKFEIGLADVLNIVGFHDCNSRCGC